MKLTKQKLKQIIKEEIGRVGIEQELQQLKHELDEDWARDDYEGLAYRCYVAARDHNLPSDGGDDLSCKERDEVIAQIDALEEKLREQY